MQIFELHFNPKTEEGRIFDSFIYEPENVYEKKLGGLYMVGEIKNALPKSEMFLDGLAKVIKKNYYSFSAKTSEKALSQSLKKANDFLSEEVKNNNVHWLGNLSLAILSLNNFKLSFSKTGDLKILLIRNGQITDISKNLSLQDIEPYPLKVFFNVISGKLARDDIILVLTKKIFDFFSRENIIVKIAQKSRQQAISEKNLKEIFSPSLLNERLDPKISGICLLTIIKEKVKQKESSNLSAKNEERRKKINFQKETKPSLRKALNFLFIPFGRINKIKLSKLPKKLFSINGLNQFLEKSKKKFARTSSFKISPQMLNRVKLLEKTKSRSFPFLSKRIRLKTKKSGKNSAFLNTKKILTLTLALILLLFLGFLIFKNASLKEENKIKTSLTEIEEKISQADNLLLFNDQKKANFILKQALNEISSLAETQEETSLIPNILSLKKFIEKKLKKLNKLEIIENPEIAANLNSDFFSSPSSSLVNPPPFKFNFDLSASYFSNLYFLDKKSCQIIKYPSLEGSKWGTPRKWMKNNDHCLNPKSMAVDGSVWVLNEDNSVSRYYLGDYKETINLDIFPSLKNLSQIKTAANIPYLYFLEPIQKRIIITDKTGKIFKQFQSEKFNNLKNIATSKDGKTIYLLNGQKIYQLRL